MSRVIDWWTSGNPATKGSVDTMPNGFVRQSAASYAWANRVHAAAKAEVKLRGWEPLIGPVGISTRYFMAPPAGLDLDVVEAYAIHEKIGDGDKLDRNVWDALTAAGVWRDDVLVVSWYGIRTYAWGDVRPGAHIEVSAIVTDPGDVRRRLAEATRSARARWYCIESAVPGGF